ncbi:hypothetical protein NIES4072_04560 [Nostoc commune NIES-4072]|uniref:DUF4232 domain-containing protein n=1 Tax=Nostoc commune NIES-4072 TaxID=2005467 RepID=A0A2R5FEF9_NOSCO|nr:DUF4232 domain-containing protein [Nostoc commune]BBD65865.1 hypothetical protein NIES4070_22260 [Nostoc commune HK-02]GBG16810.1 hypothetical protein NIES4072_04560 [Nostoc commune NIES-4072]
MRISIVESSMLLLLTAVTSGCVGSSSVTNQPQALPASTEQATKATVLTSTPTPTRKTTDNSTPQATSATNPTRCETSQLSVRRVSEDAGVGNVALTYAFTNNASSPCTLYGYPGLALLDKKDQPLKGVKILRSEGTYFSSKQPQQQVTLAPGKQASFQIAYNHIRSTEEQCPMSSKIEITPPNAYEHFTLTEQINPCTGKVRVTPVRSVDTQP